VVASSNSGSAFPTTAAWPPAPKDLLPQLLDATFRNYFVRAIEEAVKDPFDQAAMFSRYALYGPALGEPETLERVADRYGTSRDRIMQRLARSWNRIRAKATYQAGKAQPPRDPACLWLMIHL